MRILGRRGVEGEGEVEVEGGRAEGAIGMS